MAPRGLPRGSPGAGPLLVALALPLLFLHVDAQPTFSLPGGIDVDLSDLAVLVVVVAAAVVAVRDGIAPLRAAPALWVASAALLAWIGVSLLVGARHAWYPTGTHAVTAAKFVEYALLAPALPLLLRRPRDLVAPGVSLVVWSVCATGFGFLQFLGLVRDWDRTPAGWRKESFLGYHNFAALSAAVLAGVLIWLLYALRGRGRVVAAVAGSGIVGMIVGGPLDALAGLAGALAALLVATRLRGTLTARRALAAVAIVAVVAAGLVVIRGSAIEQTLRFFGVAEKQAQTTGNVQSWPQRILLAYIGGRIFLDHPVVGVGWQGSGDPPAFEPYLADAHRYFDQPEQAFPSETRRWGVQNGPVQAAADMGAIGAVLFLGVFATAGVVAFRLARRATGVAALAAAAALAWTLVALAVWNGLGLVPGIPLDALTWLALGLVGIAAAQARRAA